MPSPISKSGRSRRGFRACSLLWFLISFLLAGRDLSTIWAQSAAREYDVKATLLFNFCQFVEWPAPAIADTNAPFVIGILGADPFGKFLDDLARHERAHNKLIVIRRFRNVEEALEAHILFVGKSEQMRIPSILSVLRKKPILTVADAGGQGFARRGGMVALVTEKDNIRICINLDAVRSAGLSISAKLLRLAEIVRTEP